CNDVVIIYARGTFGSGNIGCDVGAAFVDAVSAAEPGRVIVQGVPYNADILGYLNGGSEDGAKNMAALIEKAASQCPSAKIVLGGFSQGAQVTHKAVARIAATLSTKVAGIVLFGDPDNDQPFPGVPKKNVLTFCNLDDPICFGIPLPILGHQKYKKDAVKAAAWVAGKV
ncbi:cutinase, partial [Wilcoxina mikolae CBS 423.85]